LITGAAIAMFFISNGNELPSAIENSKNGGEQNISLINHITNTYHQNFHHPLAILLLQIITIIFAARTFGFLFNQIGQPTVIGEILAGIFLGPSFLGNWFPAYSNYLFPIESLANLQFLSQVGLVLFMFVIGMELDLKILRNRAKDAVLISHTGILVPYSLGIGLAYFIYSSFAPSGISFLTFSLFIGIAMSITAFPVLARILQERDMAKSKFGNFVITCAATDDITAWCILAAVIAIAKAGTFISAIFTILLVILYVFVMLKFIQPFLKKLGEVFSNKETLSMNVVGVVFGILLISSYITEILGIHALFGAFLAGVIMPQSVGFRRLLIEKVESVSVGLLLPLFFVLTGLRTQIGLLNETHLWGVCAVVIGLAVVGKFGGITLASRFSGMKWKESLTLGVLMNTRGLMELVVLNIGYDLGILSPELYAIFVIMALITTFITGPGLDLIDRFFNSKAINNSLPINQKFRILLSFANPASGKKLARIATLLIGKSKDKAILSALHVTPTADINTYQLNEYEKESFRPIKIEAQRLNIEINPLYKVSNDVSEEIINESNSGLHDMMLVGVGQSIFSGSLLGQFIGITANALNPDKLLGVITGKNPLFRTRSIIDEKSMEFISKSKIPVGIFIDHELERIEDLIIPIISISDIFLFFYAKKIANNSTAKISLLDYSGIISSNTELTEEVNALEDMANSRFILYQRKDFSMLEFRNCDLVVMSMDGFTRLSTEVDLQDKEFSSLLILRQ
jgi:Kef-type K+ transport system membrane component KefB